MKHRRLVAVQRNGLAIRFEILTHGLEVAEGGLRRGEVQDHQPARRIVDEYQQRAGGCAIFEPAMLATVDLNQFAQMNRPDFVGDRRVWRYAARAERTRFRL